MLTVEVLVQRDLDPDASFSVDAQLLDRAAHHAETATLRVYDLAGDVLSLGRYHVAPAGDPTRRVRLHRRLGGGRVMPFGRGFAGVSLTLPHRSALVAAEPLALRPEQALNRCVRALLGGLRALGVDAFYPGRDRITVDRRLLGGVSLEADGRGVTVFDTVLALDGDWLSLPPRVAAVDHNGVIAAEELAADRVTTLASHGFTRTVEELADCLAASYAEQFGVRLTAGIDPVVPADAGRRAADWIASRSLRPGLDRHAITWGQLGIIEVYLARQGNTIADVLLAGDFIGDSASLERLEQSLRACPLERAAIAAMFDGVYADPRGFLLGVRPEEIADAILRAA